MSYWARVPRCDWLWCCRTTNTSCTRVTIKARQEQVMQLQLLEGFYCETSVEENNSKVEMSGINRHGVQKRSRCTDGIRGIKNTDWYRRFCWTSAGAAQLRHVCRVSRKSAQLLKPSHCAVSPKAQTAQRKKNQLQAAASRTGFYSDRLQLLLTYL